MNIKSLFFFLALTLAALTPQLQAHSTKHNDLPVARFVLTPDSCCTDEFGVSVLGEIGPRSYRGNGTVGYAWDDCQRVKFGGEYLGEKLRYNFGHCDRERKWVEQWAVGAQYQYKVCCNCIDTIDLGGGYSRATSKHLSNHNFIARRIAGGKYWDVYGGASITPWECGTFYFDVSYDDIRYDRHFHCKDKHVRGVGGDLALTQQFGCDVDFTIHAAFKRPYREIGAYANWNNPCNWNGWGFGLFIDYVQGRDHLPNETTYGIQLAYSFGFGDCCKQVCCPAPCCGQSMKEWVADPAIYRPTVFAIAEHRTTCSLIPPTALPGDFDGTSIVGTVEIDFSYLFTTNGGTYSISFSNTNITGSIDPLTGVATLTSSGGGSTLVTVTVTNCAGSASASGTMTAD